MLPPIVLIMIIKDIYYSTLDKRLVNHRIASFKAVMVMFSLSTVFLLAFSSISASAPRSTSVVLGCALLTE